MYCPFCGKTVSAKPEDYTTEKGTVIEVKIYSCISCEFTWLPHCEEKKVYDLYDLEKSTQEIR